VIACQFVNWEIILRDFWGAILRPLVTPTVVGMQMPECEHLNPHLFEASENAIDTKCASRKSGAPPRVLSGLAAYSSAVSNCASGYSAVTGNGTGQEFGDRSCCS
jgi:hypothetical protein